MPWAMQTKPGWILSGPLLQQGTANVATEVLVAAQVDPLADQVKIYCSVSGRSKEDDKAPKCWKQPQSSKEKDTSMC